MPKIWEHTIEAHRRAVQDAVLDAAWSLVTERGLTAVTMSQVAERAGLGRATLYKYFADIETILAAWHERHVASHLEQLSALRDRAGDAGQRLEAVLHAYARIAYNRGRYDAALVSLLHRGELVGESHRQLGDLLRELLDEAVVAGIIRRDISPGELANYCLHALSAAGGLPSEVAVSRLVEVTLAGLRPATGTS